jgi:hypothetical protein
VQAPAWTANPGKLFSLFVELTDNGFCRTEADARRLHDCSKSEQAPCFIHLVVGIAVRVHRMAQLAWLHDGGIVMKKVLLSVTIAGCLVAFATATQARSAYDGSWDLLFVTQRGACDATYNFSVNISNGIVTHPNLVKFRGFVARSGAVRASVTVQDKYASGSGRLSGASGRGTWSGYSGNARCSGYWTAQRN